MSPEQAKSEPLDHRSDLYSIAVCMYEILTGERLFVHAGLTTSADEIYSQPVPVLSKKVAGLPAELDGIMQKALALSPDTRYQTAGALQEALMRCAHRNGLLMSAPELATELREACGPPEAWRGEDDDDEPGEEKRAGTEVYDALDDDDDDDDDDAVMPIQPSGPRSIHSIAARARSPQPRSPTPPVVMPAGPGRPKTEVDRFAGVELTSIINMIDLDDQGSKPLVDLNIAPALDSGPRLIDSGPRTLDSDPGLSSFVSSLNQPGAIPGTMRNTAPPMPGHAAQSDRPYTPPPLDPSEMMPTAPRRMPTAGGKPPAEVTAVSKRRQPSSFALKPWMVVVALLLVAGFAALVVALSGPNVPSGK
jgi:serine/threonine protein kinase